MGERDSAPHFLSHQIGDLCSTFTSFKVICVFSNGVKVIDKVVMEQTGSYYEPIVQLLHDEGIYVSVVNSILNSSLTSHA